MADHDIQQFAAILVRRFAVHLWLDGMSRGANLADKTPPVEYCTNRGPASVIQFRFLACLLLTGCTTNGGNFAALFSFPESLEGQNVTECGFLHYEFENVNFYPNLRQAKAGENGVGVSPGRVSDSQLRNHHDQNVCLTGHVRYTGCTVTMICTGSNFVYEIVIDDLASPWLEN